MKTKIKVGVICAPWAVYGIPLICVIHKIKEMIKVKINNAIFEINLTVTLYEQCYMLHIWYIFFQTCLKYTLLIKDQF